ncbi:putative serine/threonine-protein kinase [Podospora fimiseda]|uniref:Serine/threonine-protein kinase n=1 Tax=Podospora fimiseda TaxID=252190 RepID=A0AAN7GZ81_9PEZI|nr:putative serine/threonine-protein kinase [Podospora fimiseda]
MDEDLSSLIASLKLGTEFHLPYYVVHRTPTEEIWDLKEQIGRGGFGSVRKEELRRHATTSSWVSTTRPTVRAVKFMRKVQDAPSWNYRAELEAIVKFSQPEYDPHFVRTFGWFEDEQSVFLAMENLPAGDLEGFKNSSPAPLTELDTTQIVRHLIGGVRHMHENGFPHRDLKPSNILISSTTPSWQVKIADFGISKQTMQGVTRLDTTRRFGTLGYMAPEVLFHRGGNQGNNNGRIAYTMSVDIWAVGVIAMTLLLKREIFPGVGDLAGYIYQDLPLDFSRPDGPALTRRCREFIAQLLDPDPVLRPTSTNALSHPWLTGVEIDDREVLEIEDDSETATTSNDTIVYSDTDIRRFRAIQLDNTLLSKSFQDIRFEITRFYFLRSENGIDIESSAAHSVWTSSERVNKILNKGFLLSQGNVVLFFSVLRSRNFCGVARMTSVLDWENTDPFWVEDFWEGRFTLDWLTHTELSFDLVRHVPVRESTPGFRAVTCYDGTEISRGSAFELLRAYSAEERRHRLGVT